MKKTRIWYYYFIQRTSANHQLLPATHASFHGHVLQYKLRAFDLLQASMVLSSSPPCHNTVTDPFASGISNGEGSCSSLLVTTRGQTCLYKRRDHGQRRKVSDINGIKNLIPSEYVLKLASQNYP